MIAIAVWLGVFLEDYESRNPCPSYCEVDHVHVIKDDEEDISR